MPTELKEYLAFISYQRKDEIFAKWLQHQLEHYHLPISILEANPELNKQPRKIFLDSTELSGGILGEEIDRALSQSRFLIVICSPNSARSQWVDKEVRRFLAISGRYSVIPFIIDGLPYSGNSDTECFTPALLELRNTADEILGINVGEYGREVASVKAISYMLGIKFDSLWQRYEREKEQERLRLEEERNRLLRLQSLFLAEKSLTELAAGNLANARYLALKALPSNIDEPDRPVVPEAESALRKSMLSKEMCFHYEAQINSAVLSPGGDMIISGGDYRSLSWRRIIDGEIVVNIPKLSRILNVRLSSDNSFLIVSTYKGNIMIFDTLGHLIKVFKGHGSPIHDAILSHDNSRLYVGSAKGRIYVYDYNSGVLLHKIDAHEGIITRLTLDPAENMLISTSVDGNMKVWDTCTMELLDSLNEYISQVCFNQMNGQLLMSSNNGSLRMYDVPNHRTIWENVISGSVITCIDISPDGNVIAIGGKDGIIHFLKTETGETFDIIKSHSQMITSVKFSLSDFLLVSASADKTVKIHQYKNMSLISLKKYPIAGNSLSVNKKLDLGAILSPAGKPILINLKDQTSNKIHVTSVKFSELCIGHSTPLLAGLTEERYPRLYIWDTSSLSLRHIINLRNEYGRTEPEDDYVNLDNYKPQKVTTRMSFAPDDKFIALLTDNNTIELYNTNNCQCIRTLSGFKSIISTFTFNPSGDLIAVGDMNGNVYFIETHTGHKHNGLSIDKTAINAISFDDTGDYIALGMSDKSAVVYNLQSDTLVIDFDLPQAAKSISFLHDKDNLVVGDSSLRIYDAVNGQLKHQFSVSDGIVTRIIPNDNDSIVYFSTNVATVGYVNYTKFQNLQSLINEASALLSSYKLSTDEQKRFYLT